MAIPATFRVHGLDLTPEQLVRLHESLYSNPDRPLDTTVGAVPDLRAAGIDWSGAVHGTNADARFYNRNRGCWAYAVTDALWSHGLHVVEGDIVEFEPEDINVQGYLLTHDEARRIAAQGYRPGHSVYGHLQSVTPPIATRYAPDVPRRGISSPATTLAWVEEVRRQVAAMDVEPAPETPTEGSGMLNVFGYRLSLEDARIIVRGGYDVDQSVFHHLSRHGVVESYGPRDPNRVTWNGSTSQWFDELTELVEMFGPTHVNVYGIQLTVEDARSVQGRLDATRDVSLQLRAMRIDSTLVVSLPGRRWSYGEAGAYRLPTTGLWINELDYQLAQIGSGTAPATTGPTVPEGTLYELRKAVRDALIKLNRDGTACREGIDGVLVLLSLPRIGRDFNPPDEEAEKLAFVQKVYQVAGDKVPVSLSMRHANIALAEAGLDTLPDRKRRRVTITMDIESNDDDDAERLARDRLSDATGAGFRVG